MATSRGRGGRAAQSGSPMPAPKLQRRGSAGQAKRLCGCRNRERLRAAALFPYGGSGPSPEPAFPRCTRPRARVRKRLCAAAACPHVHVAQATAGLRRCRSAATACGASGRPGRGAIRPVAECRQAAGLSRSRSGARGCRKGPLEKKGRPAGRPRFSATAEISCFRPPSSGPWLRRTRRRDRRECHPWPLHPSCRGRGRWR